MRNNKISIIPILIVALFFLMIIPSTIGGSNEFSSTGSRSSSRTLSADIWPAFRGDFARTGNTTAEGLDYFNLEWSASLGIYWGSPVVQYDQIYIASPNRLYCYDMDGNQVWTFNAGTNYATPLVYKGRVYFATGNGILYCLDANATGSGTTTTYWTYNVGGQSHSSPTTDGTRVYYTKTTASGLQAVWITNGTKAWNSSLDGATGVESSPSYWNGKVYVGAGESYGNGNNYLFSFYANNGTLRWKFNAGSVIASTPAVEYGNVYFGTYDGRVFSVDATGTHGSTTKRWEYNTGAGSMGILSSPAVAYERVYIGARNSHLYSLDAKGSGGTTTQIWDKTLTPAGSYGIYSSPSVTSDYVFVGTTGNGFHCRDRLTGNSVWSNTFPTATYGISISPAVYKKSVILSSDNGNLYVIRPDTIPPKVSSTNPADNAVDVGITGNITITFNEKMDVFSLSTSTVTLEDSQSNPVTGVISRDMSDGVFKAYFTPGSQLEREETYTMTISTLAKDFRGNSLDGNGNGIAEGAGVDEYSFSFGTIQHGKPYFSTISKLSLLEDVPYVLDIGLYITDTDTAKTDLVITHNTTYGTLDDFNLTLKYPNGVQHDLINLSVYDGIFTVYTEVEVDVAQSNDLPVIADILPLNLVEDISFDLDMEDYITDVDTSYANLKLYDTSKYVTINNMVITFLYTEGITYELVNITVNDGGYSVYTDIVVNIQPVNDPPEFDQMPDVYVEEDLESQVSIAKYISDIDTDIEELDIIVDSPYVRVEGFKLLLLYPEKVSEDNLQVGVFDGDNYANITLTIYVEPVNDPPVIISIDSPEEGQTFEYNQSIDFNAVVNDPDLNYGDSLRFIWFSDKSGEIATTQNTTGNVLPPGVHTISLTVTDDSDVSVVSTIRLIVKAKPVVIIDPDDDEDDTSGDTTKNVTKDAGSGGFPLWILGVIVAVIVIILVVVFSVMKQKKKTDVHKEAEKQVLTAPPAMAQTAPGMAYTYPQGSQQFPGQMQYPGQYPAQQYPQTQYPQQVQQQDYFQGTQQFQEQAQYPQLAQADTDITQDYTGIEQEEQLETDFFSDPAQTVQATEEPRVPQFGESLEIQEGPRAGTEETVTEDPEAQSEDGSETDEAKTTKIFDPDENKDQ